MIIKSIPVKDHSAIARLVDYVRRDSAVLKDKDGNVFDIRHNVFGSPEQIVEQYKLNEAGRIHKRSNNNVLHHVVLSLSGEDNVTPEMVEKLTRQFIHQMNPDALFYSTLHMSEGNKNPHSHTLVSGVAAGLSVRQSRDAFKQMTRELENYVRESYPELIHSEVTRDGKERSPSDKVWQIESDGRVSDHTRILQQAAASFELAMSRNEFYELLAEDNLKTYTRGGEAVGVEDGYNYRFDTLNLDLSILDEREFRMEQLEERQEVKESSLEIKQELSLEEQRLQELENLDRDR